LSISFSKMELLKPDTTQDNFKLINFSESKDALLELGLKETEKPQPRKSNIFTKSKSSVFSDDTFAQTERLLTDSLQLKTENPFNESAIAKVEKIKMPTTPRTEVINLTKPKVMHSKNKSIAVHNANFFGSFKLERSPDSKLQTQSPAPQGQIRRDKYSNLFTKLNTTLKEQKQTPPPTKVPSSHQSQRTSKNPSPATTPSMINSRTASKSSFSFKTAPPKNSCESPKIKSFGSSIDLGSWALHLSPQKREENPQNEQDLEIIREVEKNPLMKRKFLKVFQTANSIFVSWAHSIEETKIVYQLDYGIGAKVQNHEQFRTAFKGNASFFVITGLAPRTKYRVRVCPIYPKEEELTKRTSNSPNPSSHSNSVSPRGRAVNNNEVCGQWSDIVTVLTKDIQTIDPHPFGVPCATVSTIGNGKETIVDFEKAGRVVAKNEYEFGKTSWEIKIKRQSAHQAPVDSYSFIKIGVTNKAGKTANIVRQTFQLRIEYRINCYQGFP